MAATSIIKMDLFGSPHDSVTQENWSPRATSLNFSNNKVYTKNFKGFKMKVKRKLAFYFGKFQFKLVILFVKYQVFVLWNRT